MNFYLFFKSIRNINKTKLTTVTSVTNTKADSKNAIIQYQQ